MKKTLICLTIALALLLSACGRHTITISFPEFTGSEDISLPPFIPPVRGTEPEPETTPAETTDSGLILQATEDGSAYLVAGLEEGYHSWILEIPEYYNGLPIVGFTENARLKANGITKLYLPKTMNSLSYDNIAGLDSLLCNRYNQTDYIGTVSNPYEFLLFPTVSAPSHISIHEDCRVIADEAFYESSLTSVELSDSVEYIGDSAFKKCVELDSVILSENLKYIGKNAFSRCEKLTDIIFPESLREIDSSAFGECSALANAEFGYGIQKIGTGAFYDCYLNTIILPDTVRSVGQKAFYGNPTYSISLESGITELYADSFSLLTAVAPEPEATTGLENYIVVPSISVVTSSPTYLGNAGFPKLYLIDAGTQSGITIPAQTELIAEGAFKDKKHFSSVAVAGSNKNYISYSNCIIDKSTGELLIGFSSSTIPSNGTVTSIGANAFEGCTDLRSVTIPSSVTSIGDGAFNHCTNLSNLLINYGAKSIGDDAFNGCSALRSVTVPESVLTIGDGAFRNCTNLANLNIYNGVTSIGANAFHSCVNLASVSLPYSLHTIGEYAFSETSKLTSVIFPEGLEEIGGFAFYASALESINLPDTVKSIGIGAFFICPAKTLNFGNGSIEIKDGAFTGILITELTVPENVKVIPKSCFNACHELQSVIIEGATEIGEDAFRSCPKLSSVSLPETLEYIFDSAFAACSSLTSVKLPESLLMLDDRAFSECTALTQINFPSGLRYMGNNIFRGNNSLTALTLPKVKTALGDYEFQDCTALTTLVLQPTLTEIGIYAFDGCDNLHTILFLGTVNEWNSIKKAIGWSEGSYGITVKCRDGSFEIK